MTHNNLLTSAQYGFQKNLNTLDHNILLQKLFHYGVRGVALDGFRSYLTNRIQYTEFGSATSCKFPIECGVPQGSILSPLLFLLYINDIVTTMLGRGLLGGEATCGKNLNIELFKIWLMLKSEIFANNV